MTRSPFVVFALLWATQAQSGTKLLGNDTFTGAGAVYQGVDLKEYDGAGVLITPDPADYPVTIVGVDILCVPTQGQPPNQLGAYLLDIWDEHAGPLPPPGAGYDGGTNPPIVDSSGAGIQLTSSTSLFNRVTLVPPVTVTSGRIFIAVREQLSSQDDFTTIATDLGPLATPEANWYFFGSGNWGAVDLGDAGTQYNIPGNWIIRAVVATDGGTGTGGGAGGGGGTGGGAATGGGSAAGGGSATGGGTATGGGSGTGGGGGNDGGSTGGGSATGGGAGGGSSAALALDSITPAEGADDVDTAVVLTGSGFLKVSEVLVGPKVLSGYTVKSDDVIEATVPKGVKDGTYDVQVIDSTGAMAKLSMAYTVTSPQMAKSGCGCGTAEPVSFATFALALLLLRRRAHSGVRPR